MNFANKNGCFLLFTILWFRIFGIFFIYLKFYVYRDSCLWGIVEDKILRSTHIIRIMFLMIIFVPSNSYQLQWYNWKRWYMRQIHTTRASGMRSLNEDLFGCSVSFLCFLSSRHDDSILFFCSIFRWMLVWSLWRKVKKILRIGGGRKIFLFYFILFPLSSKNILENLIFFFWTFS